MTLETKDSFMNNSEESKKKDEFLTSFMLAILQAKEKALNVIAFKTMECIMSHSRLVAAVRLVLFLQYMVLSFFLYHFTRESMLTPSKIRCQWKDDANSLNETFQSMLSSLCLNSGFNDRFSTIFLALEGTSILILILKLFVGTPNTILDYIGNHVSDKLLYGISAVTKVMILLTPLTLMQISSMSIPFLGAFISLLFSPIVLIFRLLVGLITLPISMILLYPMRERITLDFSHISLVFTNINQDFIEKSQLDLTKEVRCYDVCKANFDSSWSWIFLYLFICYTVTFWFIHFTKINEETSRKSDVKERVSENVEFIRVSEEVSDDFNYEEVTGEKIHSSGNVLVNNEIDLTKTVSAEVSVNKIDVDHESSKPEIVPESHQNNESDRATICKSDLILNGIANSGTTESVFGVNKSIDKIEVQTESKIKFENELPVKKEIGLQIVTCVEKRDISTNTEIVPKKFASVVGTVKKLDKECQTIASKVEVIKGQPKVNKNRSCEKLIQTDLNLLNLASKLLTESTDFEPDYIDNKENRSLAEKAAYDTPSVEFRNQKQKKASSYPSVSKIKNKVRPLSERADAEKIEDNVKFSFSELSIVPPGLDLEEKIKQRSLTPDINVETFLSQVEQEKDKHQIYVEKELLMKLLQDVILTARVTGVSDCDFCPKSKKLTRDCTCRVHKLIESFTKKTNSSQDHVDGMSFNFDDSGDSDDESFFSGFRL